MSSKESKMTQKKYQELIETILKPAAARLREHGIGLLASTSTPEDARDQGGSVMISAPEGIVGLCRLTDILLQDNDFRMATLIVISSQKDSNKNYALDFIKQLMKEEE